MAEWLPSEERVLLFYLSSRRQLPTCKSCKSKKTYVSAIKPDPNPDARDIFIITITCEWCKKECRDRLDLSS